LLIVGISANVRCTHQKVAAIGVIGGKIPGLFP